MWWCKIESSISIFPNYVFPNFVWNTFPSTENISRSDVLARNE